MPGWRLRPAPAPASPPAADMGAAVGQNAILPWNLGVGSIPTLASISNCNSSRDLGTAQGRIFTGIFTSLAAVAELGHCSGTARQIGRAACRERVYIAGATGS